MVNLPRIVITAPASGQGKTTVAVGIMAALTADGYQVAPGKIGPDYIDPGYHALATGRPGRNLDPWLCGEDLLAPLLVHGFLTPTPADIAVVEGVMGLFDGRIGTDGFASTAHVAKATRSPVVAVIDISSASRTVAAIAHGLGTYDPDINLAGVILNKSGSTRHADDVRRAVESLGLPVLGVLPRDAGVSAPSRHLGLVPAAERTNASAALDRLAEQTAEHLDLPALLEIARRAPDLQAQPWQPPIVASAQRRVVAVAGGRAFTFRYAETEELLRAAGCEPVVFDPAIDHELPSGTCGLYLGGGFPEMHATPLAGNRRLLAEIHDAVASGMPTVAECAGLLYLARSMEGHQFVGVVPADAQMHPHLTLRYGTATTVVDTLLGPAGTTVHGHEFHRTRTSPAFGEVPAWLIDGAPDGFALDPASTGVPTLHASYLHVHWAGNPNIAAQFSETVHGYDRLTTASAPNLAVVDVPKPLVQMPTIPVGLDHHGDADLAPGLADFAVNVRMRQPPVWLAQVITATTEHLGAYPSTSRALTAIAARHNVSESMVLPTSGGAEAFTLIARAIDARRPTVVHPQFTEPESALRRAGRPVERVLLHAEHGFRLQPEDIPTGVDLLFIGNPTNPTGALHARATLQQLRSSGRVVVIDEAFMDAIPGESESMIGPDMENVLIVRSLTKTWGIAGIRAGYVIGDPELISLLGEQQPMWSVSAPAAAAMEAVASDAAVAEANRAATQIDAWRGHLVRGLERLQLHPSPSQAPFVLVRVPMGTLQRLRDQGFALRRCDTFPGLGPEWVRIAVREPAMTDALIGALTLVLASTAEATA